MRCRTCLRILRREGFTEPYRTNPKRKRDRPCQTPPYPGDKRRAGVKSVPKERRAPGLEGRSCQHAALDEASRRRYLRFSDERSVREAAIAFREAVRFFGCAPRVLQTDNGLEFSGRAFPCTIDIYKDSILPARIYFDMADTLAPLFEGVDVNVTECYVDVTFMEYDSVGEITVPDEAVSQAVDITDESLDLPADDSGLYESDVTPAEPVETDEALGDSWESYTVQINDTVITLPCSMSDLEAAGVALDTEYTPEDYVVNAGEFELAWFEDTSGDSIMVDMTNTGEEAAAIRDCQVSSICADAYSLSNGSLKVIFPGGIQIGSTEGDLLEAYGEPDDTYEDEEYGNSHFWYGDGSYMSSCNASITPDSGLVEMITIDCEG